MLFFLLTIFSFFSTSFGISVFCSTLETEALCSMHSECTWNGDQSHCGSVCGFITQHECESNYDCRWLGFGLDTCVIACKIQIDICYVVDTSLSITIHEWGNIQQFLISSIKSLSPRLDSESLRAGVVTFDSFETTVFPVRHLADTPDWEQQILDTQCFQQRKQAGNSTGGATYTVLGVTRCLDLLDAAREESHSDISIVVLATDGQTNGPTNCYHQRRARRGTIWVADECTPCEVSHLHDPHLDPQIGDDKRNDQRIFDKGYKSLNVYLKNAAEFSDELSCLIDLNEPVGQFIEINNGTLNNQPFLLKKVGELVNAVCGLKVPPTSSPTLGPTSLGGVAGDPVIITFDGYEYEWQGLCSYVLTMDCDGKFNAKQLNSYEKFKIIATNKPCDLGTCIGNVIAFFKEPDTKKLIRIDFLPDEIQVDGEVIKINEGGSYSFGGSHFNLSLVDKSFKEMDEYHLQFDLNSFEIISNATEENYRLDTPFGIAIEWNGYSKLMFDVSSFDFKSIKTCGLLGHRDNNARNDLRFPDGSKLEVFPVDAADDFEESWLIQSFVHHWLDRQSRDPRQCKSSTPRKLCDGSKSKQHLAKTMCDGFIDSIVENSKCARKINDEEKKVLSDTCNHDLCFCYNDDIFECGKFLHKYLQTQMECSD